MSDIAISFESPSAQISGSDRNEDTEEGTPLDNKASTKEASEDDQEEDQDVEPPTQNADEVEPPLPNEDAPPLPTEEVPPLPNEEAPPLLTDDAPPLPIDAPPLPAETPPVEDDGWEPKWDDRAQAYYFFNRFTNLSQWDNPRVPEVAQPPPPGVSTTTTSTHSTIKPVAGGYDPAIHGDYDPNADYAQVHSTQEQDIASHAPGTDPAAAYAATGAFNRFTGKWQNTALNPENFNDENKSKRQMNAFFDVDAAANSHDGKSLKAERAGKKLSKQELKAFKEKRRDKKEEKRRAWLRD
jgi:hypothetical protein